METSVIMATYKESRTLLSEAIESILGQTYTDFEFIIILDNPDNIEHIEIIKEYQKNDPRIKFYINESNMGLTATLNRGIDKAEGKYICRMDADDISLPDRLQRQKEYLETGKFDLIGGISQIIDEKGESIYSIKKVPCNPEKIKKCIAYNQVIAHPTWFGKKEVFLQLKGYRQIPLCEDYDFTLRVLLRGYRISNINKVVLKYRMTSQSISRSNLFDQYLYARYITSEYKKGKVANPVKAKEYVSERNKKERAARYLKANIRFNNLLKDLEDKKIFQFLKDGFLLLFTSVYYLDKIYRLARVTLAS